MDLVYDYLIAGSGCSGAMSAETLVNAGVNVTMIDTGVVNEEVEFPKNKNFLTARTQDDEQYKYLIGTNGEGISWDKISKGAQVTPPRQYISKLTDKLIPISSKNFSPLESLGYGGLGIGWGLQCWEYSDPEVTKTGLDLDRIRKSYEVISERIGISATKDTASLYTINSLKKFLPSAKADRNHTYIQHNYNKRKSYFLRKNVFIGRTPLALLTKPNDNRKSYRYLDTDFYSDADKSAWRPWITIDKLKKKQNFHYIGKTLVISFKEEGDLVIVKALDLVSNEERFIRCKNFILATSALGSARIVMRSQGKIGSKVPLLSNPHTYIPCVQPKMLGKPYEDNKLGFGQLSYFIDPNGDDNNISVASSYSYQSLMLFRIINQLPFNFSDGRIISRFLTPGLVILIAQHPDSRSKLKYLKLVNDESSITKDKIVINYELNKTDEVEWERREKAYMSVLRKLKTYPLKQVKTEHGSSIHYAGTLPFSESPKPMHLSHRGRLHHTKHVYVADSSGFKYLPAKGLTFTLMANAHIVAENILEDNK